MATIEQLGAALTKADAAGNTADAKAFADAIRAMKGAQASPPAAPITTPSAPQETNPINSDLSVNNVARSFSRGVPVIGGLLDEANAATNATLDPIVPDWMATAIPGNTWAERYENSLKMQRDTDKGFDEAHPLVSTGAQIAGGLASGGALAKAAPGVASTVFGTGAKTLPGQMLKGGAAGAALSGAHGYAAGEGGGEQRLEDAKSSAAWGAAFGASAPVVMKWFDGLVGQASRRVPTEQELNQAADALYKVADTSGLVVKRSAFDGLVTDVEQAMRHEGIDPTMHPYASAALKRLTAKSDELATAGTNLNIKDFEMLRRVVGAAGKSPSPDDRRLAGAMKDIYDRYVQGITPGDVTGGDHKVATQILPQARALWNKMSKSETITDMVGRAKLTAEAQQGGMGNLDRTLRNEFTSLAKNKSKMRLFTPDEQQAIRDVVRGTATSNTLKYLGNLSPRSLLGAILSGSLGTVTYAAGGGPLAAAVPIVGAAVGEASKRGASAVTARKVGQVAEQMRAGGKVTHAIPQATKDTIQRMTNSTATGMINQ